MLKKTLLFALLGLLFSFSSYAEETKDPYRSTQPYHFKIQKKQYRSSSFFEIDTEDTYRGNIKKSSFRIRNCYDLSDKDGWCATGIKRFLSVGLFFNWASVIDIWGVNDEWLGMIEGNILSTSKAKFSIYDREETLIGIAYMDLQGLGVTITPPENEAYTLARLERVFVPDAADYWKVTVYEPEKFDDRLIRIFAAFCVDTQASFYRDN